MNKPEKLLSIITITKNNHEDLKKTIESIVGFLKFFSVELIIVNGEKSLKAQIEILDLYNKNKNIKILNGTDTGIYNAMNNGLKEATGKYIWLLNSGDHYAHEIKEQNIIKLLQNKHDLIIFAHRNKVGGKTKPPRKLSKLNLAIFLTGIFNHQSIIFERNLMSFFLEKYKLRAEYESYYQMLAKTPDILYINKALSIFPLGGFGQSNKRQTILDYINIMFTNKNLYFLLSIPGLLLIAIK